MAISAMKESETLRCVYGLVSAGILTLDEPAEGGRSIKHLPGTPGAAKAFRRDLEAKRAAVGKVSHYELLEISRHAASDQIKSAYFGLVKKFHPDRHRTDDLGTELSRQLEELIIQTRAAYDILSDPDQKSEYDRRLPPEPSPAPIIQPKRAPSAPPPSPPPTPPPTAPKARAERPKATSKPTESDVTADADEAEPSPATVAASPKEIAEAQYRIGRGQFAKQDYHGAVENFRASVRLAPEDPKYHLWLARTLVKNPNWAKMAEQHFRRFIELVPFETAGYLELARLYEQSGLATRAKKVYREILQLEPNHEIAKEKLAKPEGTVGTLILRSTTLLKRLRGKEDAEDSVKKTTARSR